ncbi:Integrase OS=Castellaniella defragrans OX=75697 GN=HNR28_002878 PE=4 SV=1 [Castellaniella denitrificans]
MAQNLLSTRTINSAKAAGKPYQLRDGGSLFLSVQPSGSKLWRYRYRLSGKAQVYAIGRYPDVTLAQARRERDRVRDLILQGIHPLGEQRPASHAEPSAPPSFETIAHAWLAANPQWSPGYSRQIRRYFEKDILPAIGNEPVADLTPMDIRALIASIAERGARCAALLAQQWISQVFSHAILQGLREDNPASLLKGLVRRPTVRHHPPLGWSDIPEFCQRLDAWDGYPDIAIGLRLLALTFVRPSELRLARWQEFDFDNAVWIVPKERMKMRRPHMVPLSRQALAMLHGPAQAVRPGCCFPTTGIRAVRLPRAASTTPSDAWDTVDPLTAGAPPGRLPAMSHARFVGSRTLLMQDWADTDWPTASGMHACPRRSAPCRSAGPGC